MCTFFFSNQRGIKEKLAGLQANITTTLATLKTNATAKLTALKENVDRRMAQSLVASLELASAKKGSNGGAIPSNGGTNPPNGGAASPSSDNIGSSGASDLLGGNSFSGAASPPGAGGDSGIRNEGIGVNLGSGKAAGDKENTNNALAILRERINSAMNASRGALNGSSRPPAVNNTATSGLLMMGRSRDSPENPLPLFMEDKIRAANPLKAPTFQGLHRDAMDGAAANATIGGPKESLRSSLALPTDNLPGGLPGLAGGGAALAVDLATGLKVTYC